MTKLPIKKIFLSNTTPFFKSKGYILNNGPAPKYVLKAEKYYAICGFNFFTKQDKIYGGKLNLCLWDVENIIMEIQYPMQDFTSYLKKDSDFFSTVGDMYGQFNPKDVDLDTEEKIAEYADTVKTYIEADGQKFIDTYSHLPNVLAEMDKLEAEGKLWNGGAKRDEILSGGGDAFFRGLIISKLCNDKNYEKKIDFVDHIFYDKQYGLEDWLSHYEKLKEKLNTLSPLYNL